MSALITFSGEKFDPKKITGNLFSMIILGVLGLSFYVWILPFLISIVWGTIQLAIGAIVAAVLLMILTNKKFWRAIKYFGEFTGETILGKVIEMNRWNMLAYRIEKQEIAAEKLRDNSASLKGLRQGLKTKISEKDKVLRTETSKFKLLKESLQENPENGETLAQLEITSNRINNAKKSIDNWVPALNDYENFIGYADRAYNQSRIIIETSKEDLATQREIYETVTVASEAVGSAWEVIVGDKDTDNDAKKALDSITAEINKKLGDIQQGIQMTSKVMDGKDLENTAMLRNTLNEFKDIDLISVNYSTTVGKNVHNVDIPSQRIENTSGKYSRFLGKI